MPRHRRVGKRFRPLCEIKPQTFAADEVHNNSRRVITTRSFPFIWRLIFFAGRLGMEHDALKDFAEHLRIDSDLLREGRVFADGEVVCFQEIVEQAGESGISNPQFGRGKLEFVIIKQAAVEKRNSGQTISEI